MERRGWETMKYSRGWFALLGMALLAGLPRPVSAAYGGEGGARSAHGRVSAVNGDLLVKGPDDSDWSYVERNATVHDDDLVRTDEDTTAEIEMERGAWLRLGPDSDVAIR